MARGFNLTAELNLRGPSNIRTVVADIRRQLGTINANVNVRLDPGVARNITAINQTFRAFNNTLQATNASANATALSLRNLGTAIQQVNNGAANLPANLQQINAATRNVAQQNAAATAAVHNTTSAFMEFGRQSALAVRRFAAFATVTGVIYKVSSALSSATTDFITFNQELVRVSQVTDTSVKNLGGLVNEITNLSTKFGVSSNELIKVSSTLAQAGLSARDTEKALKALALSALAPSFDNLNSTVEGSIALMRQFGISAGELDRALGSVNAVAAKFAVEAGDIITAIQRTGGVFATASKGVSEGTQALNEFMAVFTSVRATTRESAETIATGLRTIFTRIQRGDTIDALKEYGVTLTDLQGKFVGPYEAVRRLSEGLSQLDPRDLKFSRIVEELGGFRQIGKVIPLIQQFATAQAALKVAQSGQDSLATDAATAQQSLAVQMAKVRNEFVGLVRSIGQSSGFQSFVKLSLDLTSNLIRLTDAAKGALPALGAIFAMRGLSAAAQFGRGFIGGMRPNRNSQGGQIRAFAAGGHVPGSGNGDTVPAMLTPGEFVMNKSAVSSIGVGNLHRMNRHAGGGKVGPVSIQKLPQAVSLISQNPKVAKYMNVNEDSASGFIKQIEPWMLGLNVKSIAREIYNDMRKGLPISPTNQRFSLGKNKATPTQIQSYSNLLGRRGSDKAPKDFLAGKEGERRISQLGTADESPKWSEAYERLLSRTIKERVGKQYIPTGEIENIPRRNSYPVDLISADGKSVGEVKFRPSGMVSKTDYLDKLLRARVVRNLTRPFTLSSPESKDIGNINVYEMPNKDLVMNEIRELYAKNQGKNNRASGGFIRKFANAGLVTPTAGTTATSSEILKVLTLQGAMQASGANAGDILKILKKKNELSPQEKSIKDQILAAYTKKTSGIKAANDLDIEKATTDGLLFGAAGFKGKAFATTPRMDIPGLNNPVKVRITSGVLDKDAAGRDIKRMAQAMSGESQNLTKNIMIRDVLKQVGPIYSDFDRTLAFGADKILSDPKKPRFSEFSDETKVERALAKATLSKLGKALASQVKKTPELLDNLHVISARPQSTMGLIATWLAKNGLPIPTNRIKGVGGPDRTAEQIAELKLKEMDKSGSFIDDDERNINVAKAVGMNTYLYKNKKVSASDRKKMGEANAQGYMAESIINQLGGPIANKATTNYGIDFPDGLQDAAKYFNLPQNIPTDAKLTLNGPAELKGQIGNYLKARGYALGGHVQAMVSNGEAYIPPDQAKQIGYNTLNRMNQADRNGMSSFSSGGGISVFKGSGSGTSDSIGPVSLPVGSFILREAATKALNFRSGGAVRGIQRFNRGGTAYEAVASFDAVSAQAEKAVDDLLAKIVNQIATANPSVDFDTAYRSAEDQVVGGVSLGTRQAADLGDQNAAKAVADAQRRQVTSLTRQIRATDSSVSITEAKAAAERRVGDAWGGLYKAVQTNTQSQSRLAQSFPTLSKAFQGASRGLGSIRSRIMGPSDEEVGNMSDSQRAQYENKRSRRASYMNTGLALAFAAPMAAEAAGSMVGGSNGRGVAAAGTALGGAVAVGAQLGPIGMVAGAFVGLALAMDSFHKAVAEADIDLSKKKIEGSATTAEAQLEKLNKNPRDTALTSSIVKNFKDIAAEEEKMSARQTELRQPSMLTRGLEAASFGMYKAARPTNEQIAEEQTANQKVGGEIALKTLTAKVESGLNIEQALASFGGDKDLAKLNIAQTNKKFNLENQRLENIKKTPGQDPQIIATIEKRQKELVDAYFKEETASLQATTAERARVQALQQSARVLNLSSVSIAKTFENMDQAIDSATTGLDRASQRIDDIASGQVSLKTQFKSTDILKNPNAYSQKERQAAVGQVSGMFGKDQNFVEGLSKFGASAEDTITKISVKAQQNSNGDSGTLGEDITRDLTKQLIDTFGDNRISDAIRDQLKGAVQDNIKQNDGVLNPQSLIDSVGGLKQLIDSQKKSFDTMMKQYAFIEKALDTYGNAVQKAAELQTQAVAKFASLQGYLSDSRVSLKEALGEGRNISLREKSSGRYTEAAINAGVKPGSLTAANLTNQRNILINQRGVVEGRMERLNNSGNLADPGVISLISKQKEALASLNRQIEATEKGLDGLPDLIKQDMQDTLSKIGQLVQERESRTQAGAAFGERLVTSTPTELISLNSTYDLLNRTLNGQITTINQSASAQQAYQKVIEDGGTNMEAMTAAQDAFASDAKNSFSLFNEMIQVSGLDTTDKQRANNLRADLIQNTARNQGLNVENNPFLREIVANLRAAPKEDPQIKALENLYKQQQAALGEATQKAINPLLEKQGQILNEANTSLIAALDRVTNAFNGAQGSNEGLGLVRPGDIMRRAQGGPVYAAGGTLVNYEPRGTDTVPAMLTPGEFVVNRAATQRNLPLLKSINSGNYAKGGVVYLAGGSTNSVDQLVANLVSGEDNAGDTLNMLVRRNRYRAPNNLSPSNPLFRFLLARQGDTAMTGARVMREWSAAVQASPLGINDPIFQPYLQEVTEARLGGLDLDDVPDIRRPRNINPNGLERYLGIQPVKPKPPASLLNRTGDMLGSVYQGVRNPRAALSYGVSQAPGIARAAAPIAGRFFGSIFGATSGAMADPRLTNRNRLVNTGLGMLTGTGETMGDVGAQSMIGRATGVEQGTMLDRQIGNFSQLGLTSVEHATMGVPAQFAPITAALAMNIQETAGLLADNNDALTSEIGTRRNIQASRKPRRPNDHLGGFELNAMQRRAVERKAELLRLKKQDQAARGNSQGTSSNQNFYDEQIRLIDDSFNTMDTVPGIFWDTKQDKNRGTGASSARLDAATEAHIEYLDQQQRQSELVAEQKRTKKVHDRHEKAKDARAQRREDRRIADRASSSIFGNVNGESVDARNMGSEDGNMDFYGLGAVGQRVRQKEEEAYDKRKQAYNQTEANRLVDRPTVPPGTTKLSFGGGQNIDPAKETEKLGREKKEIEGDLDRYKYKDPKDMTDNDKKEKEKLERELSSKNREIIALHDKVREEYPVSEQNRLWKNYDKKQERDANRAQIVASNRANTKRFNLELAVGKAVGMGAPNKFRSPEAFMGWREQALSKLKSKFNLSGSPRLDEKLLTKYGLSAGAAQDLFRPFTPEQAEALIQTMSQQTVGGSYKYSDKDIAILRMSQDQIEQTALRIYNQSGNYGADVATMAERKRLEKAQGKTFGKLLRNFSSIDRMAARGQGMNPAQQAMLKNNISKQLTKMGYINPQDTDAANAARLASFNINNTVGFLYPRVSAGNSAFRVAQGASSGGMIYAANGTLVNYQPRGTDTVPAMLTPGEFVVNAQATSQHLPLLQAINKSKGGGVLYRAAGGETKSLSPTQASSQIRKSEKDSRLQSVIIKNTDLALAKSSSIDNTTQKTADQQLPNLERGSQESRQFNGQSFNTTFKYNKDIIKNTSRLPKFQENTNNSLTENNNSLTENNNSLGQLSQQTTMNSAMLALIKNDTMAILGVALPAISADIQKIPNLNQQLSQDIKNVQTNTDARFNTVDATLNRIEGSINVNHMANMAEHGNTQQLIRDLPAVNQKSIEASEKRIIGAINALSIKSTNNHNAINTALKEINSGIHTKLDKHTKLLEEIKSIVENCCSGRESKKDATTATPPQSSAPSVPMGDRGISTPSISEEAKTMKTWSWDIPEMMGGLKQLEQIFPIIKMISKLTIVPNAILSWVDAITGMGKSIGQTKPRESEGLNGALGFLTGDARSGGSGLMGLLNQHMNAGIQENGTMDRIFSTLEAMAHGAGVGGSLGLAGGAAMGAPGGPLIGPTALAGGAIGAIAGAIIAGGTEAFKIGRDEPYLQKTTQGQYPNKYNTGGMVYASNGKLINYQPRGNDTVPAMLTPGEFVVNAQSTSRNLPLLQAINKNKGGVVYAQDGMRIPFNLNDIADKNPGKVGYATSAEERYMERWKKTHTDLLADSSEGPGMLGAPFHERFSAGLNMLADIGSAKLAGGAKITNPGLRQSIRGVKTPMLAAKAPLVPEKSLLSTIQLSDKAQLYAKNMTSIQRDSLERLVSNAPGLNRETLLKDIVERMAQTNLRWAEGDIEFIDAMKKVEIAHDARSFAGSPRQKYFNEDKLPRGVFAGHDVGEYMIGMSDRAFSSISHSPQTKLSSMLDKMLSGNKSKQQDSSAVGVHELGHLVQNMAREKHDAKGYPRLLEIIKSSGVNLDEFLSGPGYKEITGVLGTNYVGKRIKSSHPFELFTTLNQAKSVPETRDLFDKYPEAQKVLDALWKDHIGKIEQDKVDTETRMKASRITKPMAVPPPPPPPPPPKKYSTGGMIYASRGTLVHYQPRGTDTVPAMLTPGEFVVNRQATQQNLSLLQAINGGATHMSRGGSVYLANGGLAGSGGEGFNFGQMFTILSQSTKQFTNSLQLAISTLSDYQKQLSSGTTNSVSNNSGSNNPNMDGLSQFTNTFNNFIGQLEKLNLPPQINIQGTHKVEVVINGASAFANMQEPIQRMILDQVNGAMNKLAMKTEGVLQV